MLAILELCWTDLRGWGLFSKSWEEHVSRIRAVLDRLKGAGLTAKLSKCCFGTTSCTYLGHVVGSGVVCTEPSKCTVC